MAISPREPFISQAAKVVDRWWGATDVLLNQKIRADLVDRVAVALMESARSRTPLPAKTGAGVHARSLLELMNSPTWAGALASGDPKRPVLLLVDFIERVQKDAGAVV